MKIGIDYRLANCSHRGMARYCREIVKCIIEQDFENEYVLIIDEAPKFNFQTTGNWRYAEISHKNFIIGEQFDLPNIIKKEKFDIFWSPYNTFPVRLPPTTKLAVTIHDVIFFYKDSGKMKLYQRIGKWYRKYILKFFHGRIDICFSVSNFSKEEIKKYINLKCPIHVTYNCINKFYNKVIEYKEKNTINNDNYFFTLSGDSPSKNLEVLINVFNNHFPSENLLIAGVTQKSELRKYSSDRVRFLDEGVPDDVLIKSYLESKCFLFCSKFEGFGIPLIEAAICEKPIIASNTTSIPEILNENGMLIEPTISGIKKGICDFLNNGQSMDIDYRRIINRFIDWQIPAKTIIEAFYYYK